MKRVTMFCAAAAVLAAAFLLAGCPGTDGAESTFVPQEGEFTVAVQKGEGAKYFSLSAEGGVEVKGSAINSTGWDIGFERTRQIMTNSGSTAANLNSGGKGYVWFTEKFDTDFDAVVFADRVQNDTHGDAWGVDKQAYLNSMSGADHNTFNVMGYIGYDTGDGLSVETCYEDFAQEKGKSAYHLEPSGRSYSYSASKRVFIVRHGNGEHHSKVQITTYTSTGGSTDGVDTFVVKFKNID